MPAAAFSSGRTHHELLLIEVGPDATADPAGRRVGLYHFGLKVGDTDDELREALARLTRPASPSSGASDHTVTHSLYILDPDGNEIELYVDTGVDWNDPPRAVRRPGQGRCASSSCSTASCWPAPSWRLTISEDEFDELEVVARDGAERVQVVVVPAAVGHAADVPGRTVVGHDRRRRPAGPR